MHEFNYERVASLSKTLERINESHQVLAGGTDLLTRLKLGLDKPQVLVDIQATELESGVSVSDVTAVEALLKGGEPSESLIEEAALLATQDFTPLSENGYKINLVQGLVKTALQKLTLSDS